MCDSFEKTSASWDYEAVAGRLPVIRLFAGDKGKYGKSAPKFFRCRLYQFKMIGMKQMEREIPISEKYVLSTEEASDYFQIGINRLRKMIREEPEAEWILWTGTHASIKRKLFEKKVDAMSVV